MNALEMARGLVRMTEAEQDALHHVFQHYGAATKPLDPKMKFDTLIEYRQRVYVLSAVGKIYCGCSHMRRVIQTIRQYGHTAQAWYGDTGHDAPDLIEVAHILGKVAHTQAKAANAALSSILATRDQINDLYELANLAARLGFRTEKLEEITVDVEEPTDQPH